VTIRTGKRLWACFLVNHIYRGTRCFEAKRRLLNGIGHDLGEGTKVVGPIFCTGILHTGKECWIGADLTIHGHGRVILGDRCDVGPGVMFLTGGHRIGEPKRRAGEGITADIRVGDGCWIGGRATLLPGTVLGEGSILAACGCAAAAVEPHVLAGGIPAKMIRKLP